MKKEQWLNHVKHQLIVSCQALPGEPFYEEAFSLMPYFAKAAAEGGACALRLNSVRDISAVKEQVNLPIIGLIKQDYQGFAPFITPTVTEIEALMDIGVDVIAFDATNRIHPNQMNGYKWAKWLKQHYPDQLFMADIANFEEGYLAYEAGIDMIGTTLFGYTEDTSHHIDPSYDLVAQLSKAQIPVIAEGRIHHPQQAQKMLDLGAISVVVGGAITRPKEITQRFVQHIL